MDEVKNAAVSVPKIDLTTELFDSESFIKNIEKFKNNLPKSNENEKWTLEKKKNPLWESADINSKSNTKLNLFAANRMKPIQSAALQKKSVMGIKLNNNDDQKIDENNRQSTLFDYRKLNEIQLGIDSNSEIVLVKKPRPISAVESRQMETIDLKIELPELTQHEIIENDRTSSCDWSCLPQEIWLNILINLSHKDLAQFGRSCKIFHQIYSDNVLCKFK